MDISLLILSFIFGTIAGSFLNVVSLRFKTGAGIGGRSKCMTCNRELTPIELVPILSFLLQRGACRKCKSKISIQYPLVEFFAGILFLLIFLSFPPYSYAAAFYTLIHILSACVLLVVVVYDVRHKIIPDSFVFTFDFLALASLFAGGASWWHMPNFESLIAGPLLAVPFALLWVISRGRWIGLGDAKLALGIGWLLGVTGGINAVVLAFWIGAAVSIIWMLVTYHKFRPRMEIPFGPFLILGMYIVLIFGMQVMDIDMVRGLISGF